MLLHTEPSPQLEDGHSEILPCIFHVVLLELATRLMLM